MPDSFVPDKQDSFTPLSDADSFETEKNTIETAQKNKAKEVQEAALKQQAANDQREAFVNDPKNMSSTQFKKKVPRPETIEEQIIYDKQLEEKEKIEEKMKEELEKQPSFKELAISGLKHGKYGVNRGRLGWQSVVKGKLSIEDAIAIDNEMIAAAGEDITPDFRFTDPHSVASNMVAASAELLPFIGESVKEGAKGSALLGTAGAVVGTFVAPGPGTLTGGRIGIQIGGTLGVIKNTMEVEGGNLAFDLVKDGVSPEMAKQVSIPTGIMIGGLEVFGVGRILRRLPVANRLFKKKASDVIVNNPSMRKSIMNAAVNMATDVTAETGIEIMQELMQISGEFIAKTAEEMKTDKEFDKPEMGEVIERLLQVAALSAQGFPLITLPGVSTQFVRERRRASKAKRAQKLQAKQTAELDPTDQEIDQVEKEKTIQTIKAKVAAGEDLTAKESVFTKTLDDETFDDVLGDSKEAGQDSFTPEAPETAEKVKRFDDNLDEDLDQDQIEEANFIRNNFDEFDAAYDEESKSEYRTTTPNIISADLAKTAKVKGRENFSAEMSAVRHEASSAFAKYKYDQLLNKQDTIDRDVMVLGGVSGAGKTSSLKNLGVASEAFAAVYDTNLSNFESGKKIIDQALASGRGAAVYYVDRDAIDAFKKGVYKRFQGRPERRIVPVDIHINNYKSRNVIKQLAEHYAGNENVNIRVIDNDRGPGEGIEIPLDKLGENKYTDSELSTQLTEFINKEFEDGKLSESEKATFLGQKIPDSQGLGRSRPKENVPKEQATPSKEIIAEKVARGQKLTDSEVKAFPDLAKISKQISQVQDRIKKVEAEGRRVPDSLPKALKALRARVGVQAEDKVRKPISADKIVGRDPEKKTVIGEMTALRHVLKKQAQAARLAAVETRKAERAIAKEEVAETKADLKNKAKERQESIQKIKDDVVANIKARLPLASRGRFIEAVARAKTPKDLSKAIVRADLMAEKIMRRDLVNQIKKQAKRLDASQVIAVDYKQKIRAVLGGLEFTKKRAATMKAIQETQKYIDRQRAAGNDVFIPQQIINKLSILGRKPLDEISTAQLQSIQEEIQTLADIGKTKLRVRQALEQARKERDLIQLAQDSKKLVRKEIKKAKPGEKLTFSDTFNNSLNKAINAAQHVDHAIMPMDVIFDILDGNAGYQGANFKIFKKTVDQAFGDYLDGKDKISNEAWRLAADLNLDTQNFERIGVFAADQQAGGRDKLHNIGMTDAEVEAIKLTPKEQKMYEYMRDKLDAMRPEIAETMKQVYNKELGDVTNYFSFMTDWDNMTDFEIRERFADNQEFTGPLRKNVQKGFTEKRTGAGKQKIKVDAMEIFLKHTDDAAYLLSVGPQTKYLGELSASKTYGDSVGEFGQELVREWVDTVARKGGASQAERIAFIDTLRKNVGAAILTFKLSSALIQPTALLDGASIIGPWAFKGASDMKSRAWRVFLRDNFAELRDRGADDPSYVEFSDNKTLAKAQKTGFWALQKLDLITASAITAGAYQKIMHEKGQKVDLANPDKEAVAEAQRILRRSQASAFFKDVPAAISRGKLSGNRSVDRALLQFQNFMLNRWSLIRHDAYRAGVKDGDPMKFINMMSWILLANVAETFGRRVSKEIIAGVFGTELEDFDEEDFKEDLFLNILQNIPFVSQGVSVAVYGSTPVPFMDITARGFEGAAQIFTAKKGKTKAKGAVRAATAATALAGIPGSAQARQILVDLIDDS